MPGNLTYADRVIHQLCVRGTGAESFTTDELVEEVICVMLLSRDEISRVARTYIRGHIIYLRTVRLLVRDEGGDDKIHPAERLVVELNKIPRNVLDNDPVKMKKYADLVKIGAYPLKRLTVKQLRQRLLEIQDESDDLRRDRDRLLKECERLQAELRAARRGRVPTEEIPMDIDDEEAQEASANSSQDIPQPQSNVVPLRRTPTLDYIDPVTPPRRHSTNASQYLLTPPETEERPRKRLSRNGSRAQQSFQDDRLPMDASHVSGQSLFPNMTPQTDGSYSTLEGALTEARRDIDTIFERIEAAATAERDARRTTEHTLKKNIVDMTAELEQMRTTREREQRSFKETLQREQAAQAAILKTEQTARKEAERKAQEARQETERVQREREQIKEQHGRQDKAHRMEIKKYRGLIKECHDRLDDMRDRVMFHARNRTMEASRTRCQLNDALKGIRDLEGKVEQFVQQAQVQADTILKKDKSIDRKNEEIRALAQQMKACSQAADALVAET